MFRINQIFNYQGHFRDLDLHLPTRLYSILIMFNDAFQLMRKQNFYHLKYLFHIDFDIFLQNNFLLTCAIKVQKGTLIDDHFNSYRDCTPTLLRSVLMNCLVRYFLRLQCFDARYLTFFCPLSDFIIYPYYCSLYFRKVCHGKSLAISEPTLRIQEHNLPLILLRLSCIDPKAI